MAVFVDVLRKELNNLLVRLDYPDGGLKENAPKKLTDALVWALAKGGDDVPVIIPVLKNAAMHCFHRKGSCVVEAQPYRESIKEAIEQLLGWLVLASVDDRLLSQVLPASDFSNGFYFEIPVETPGGVELIVSRTHQRAAVIDSGGSEITARHLVCASVDQFDWKPDSTVEKMKRMIWNKVFPDQYQESALSVQQVKTLNSELLARRRDEWDTEHYYLAIQCDDFAIDNYASVYKQLLEDLDNLTLVNFGVTEQASVFYMPEHNLMQTINRFLTSIN